MFVGVIKLFTKPTLLFNHYVSTLTQKVCTNATVQKRTFATVINNQENIGAPTSLWSNETIACYKKLENLVYKHKWVKHQLAIRKGENRHYGIFSNSNIYHGAFFYSLLENKAKAVITYGPYSEGWINHVHGGAMSTHHDEITGIVANLQGPCVTANLTIDFKTRLRIGQTTLYSSELEKVDGRKVFVKSKLTCPEEKIIYSEATALFIIVKKHS